MQLCLFCLPLLALSFYTGAEPVNRYLQQQLEPILIGEHAGVGGASIHTPDLVIAAYDASQYELIWQDGDYAQQTLALLAAAREEGLEPEDYHYSLLQSLLSQPGKRGQEASLAQFDILLTDGIMTYATHLIRGKVNPKSLTPTWNYEQYSVSPEVAATALIKHVRERTLSQGLEDLKPRLPQYGELKQALAFYRQRASQGELPALDLHQPLLSPGQRHPGVPLLRQKLSLLGYGEEGTSSQDDLYDEVLVAGVKQLQRHRGLAVDGLIGQGTLAALNRTIQQIVDTLKVNLERIRWVDNSLSHQFIVINIAGFELFLFQDHQLQWKTNVIVGRDYTRTPVFKEKLRYIVINPTWTVPRSIAGGIISNAQKDAGYLAAKDFIVVDNRRNPVDVQSIDWSTMNRQTFPYWFVQTPSENNALGLIKFMFPNRYAIYLHDTPAKSLFQADFRAFSHGCVRVENPFELARHILGDDRWSQLEVPEILARKQTTEVVLDKPLDIFLMYWTAMGTVDGLHFYPDVYGRDPGVLERINQPLSTDEGNQNE